MVLGVVLAASLALPAAALGAYSPSLTITRNVDAESGDAAVDITFSHGGSDAPTARLQVLSPFALESGTWNVPGRRIGTVDGSVAGTLTVEDQSRPEVRSAGVECTGDDAHTSAWRLDRPSTPLWIFVDDIAAMPFSDFAATSLQLCVPFGTALARATLHLGPVFQQHTEYQFLRFMSFWTAISTPYESGTSAKVDERETVETQSLDHWLVGTTFTVRRVTRTRRVRHKRFTDVYYSYFARIRGSVFEGCCIDIAATVFEGDRSVANPSVFDSSFSTTVELPRTTTYHAVFTGAPGEAEAPWTCTPLLPDMRCGTITFGNFSAATWDETVVRPKLTHRRIWHGRGSKAAPR